jgi:hypothetical protein
MQTLEASELKTTIDEFRRRLANDRQLYRYYKGVLYPWYPEPWAAAGAAIIARAQYWRGEMLRSKQNLARYIRGEEEKRQHTFVNGIIENLGFELKALESSLQACETESGVMLQLAQSQLTWDIDSLLTTAKHIEHYTYGG